MRRFFFVLVLLLAPPAHAQSVATLIDGELGDALARLARDAGRSAVERQFGPAYAADWWRATEAVHANARRWAAYMADQGPACAAIRTREGDASSAWATCEAGLREAAQAMRADLDQIEAALPDWERMVRTIDTANTLVTPTVDTALAAIRAARGRLADSGY